MNKEDFEISKLSYTNKDFPSIYPEILDIAKQLTNKWDPSMSNESDPGVVLLKEAAFVADHNNYNIDKNILENFLPSATQDRSVRDIVEMNGYTPRYYVSATGEVRVRYKNDNATTDANIGSGVIIPKFTLVLTTDDESISYTQITDLTLTGDDNTDLVGSCMFIQGTLQSLAINNSGIITLDNLDDNRRLYLPEAMIAQNGIYITSVDGDREEWVRDNYVLTKPSGSRIYKIDYDSYMGLPYIEFPTDIASLIGNGLNIRYISTLGEAGNVNSNSLVKVISPTEYKDIYDQSWLTEYMSPANASSFTNGKDPETINQMYNSFMKTVGTFETLVTCLDYSNYIYNIEDDFNHNLVSNVYVTDRRTDYNKALNMVTYDLNGSYFKNISLKNASLNFVGSGSNVPTNGSIGDLFYKVINASAGSYSGRLYVYDVTGWRPCDTINLNDFTNLTKAMTPYDLSIYALKLFSIADYNPYIPQKALENSFKPVTDDTLDDIKAYIEESKNICHVYKDPSGSDIFIFKNYAPLKVNIIPYYKVTKAERNEILNNIYIALSQNFNPRNIEFGEELDRDQLKKVIIDSDSRIKDISLDFDYYMKAMTTNGLEYNLNSSDILVNSTLLVDLIAKNILAGRVCLFDFGDKFNFEYGQTEGSIYNDVSSISSGVNINVNTDTSQSSAGQFLWEELRQFNVEADDKYIYKYNLHANGASVSSDIELKPYTSDGTSSGDSFTLQQIDKETNKVVYTYEYTTASNVGYKISVNNGTTLTPSPSTSRAFVQLQNCILTITKRTIYSSTETGATNVNYTLKENEAVQIIYPNYYSTKTYGTYVSYNYSGPDIKANTETKLEAPIVFLYSKDGVTQSDTFEAGSVVRANFDIQDTSTISDKRSKDGNWYGTLSSNQTISKRERMITKLDQTNLMCYWIINSSSTGENMLFDPGETEKILGSDDYFIYADEALNDIIILGSGTKITRSADDSRDWNIGTNNYDIEAVAEEGTGANIPWRKMNFNNYNLYITEMTIYTLGEGDNLHIYGWEFSDDNIDSEGTVYIDNSWKLCSANIDMTIGGELIQLVKIPNYYYIRSRLDLSMSTDHPQTLHYSPNATEYINVRTIAGVATITAKEDKIVRIQSNVPISALGGNSVDLSVYEANNIAIDLFSYVYGDEMPFIQTDTGAHEEFKGNIISIPTDKTLNNHWFPFWIYNSNNSIYPDTNEAWIIPIYVENPALKVVVGVTSSADGSDGSWLNIEDFNWDELPTDYDTYHSAYPESISKKWLVLQGGHKYYILLKSIDTSSIPTGTLYLRIWSREIFNDINPSCVIVDNPVMVTSLNKKLSTSLDSTFHNTILLDRLHTLVKGSDNPTVKPDYLYEPDSSMAIDLNRYMYVNAITGEYDMLAFDNPLILFDNNNVAHDMSIAEVDIANSVIDVSRNMRSYN